jgi:hypothetical protein
MDEREEMNKLNSDLELSELVGWIYSVLGYLKVNGEAPPTFLDDWESLSDNAQLRTLFVILGMIVDQEPPDPIPALVPA